jgi:hypothetical protein
MEIKRSGSHTPTNVIVVIGAGSIGQAIARRVSAGKHVLLSDLRQENAEAAAKTLSEAGFNVTTAKVDVSSRASVHALVEKATSLGEVSGVIHAAGVSPSQASPETILKVDLYGTALVLEEFGKVIARGGAGVVIVAAKLRKTGLLKKLLRVFRMPCSFEDDTCVYNVMGAQRTSDKSDNVRSRVKAFGILKIIPRCLNYLAESCVAFGNCNRVFDLR